MTASLTVTNFFISTALYFTHCQIQMCHLTSSQPFQPQKSQGASSINKFFSTWEIKTAKEMNIIKLKENFQCKCIGHQSTPVQSTVKLPWYAPSLCTISQFICSKSRAIKMSHTVTPFFYQLILSRITWFPGCTVKISTNLGCIIHLVMKGRCANTQVGQIRGHVTWSEIQRQSPAMVASLQCLGAKKQSTKKHSSMLTDK